MKNIVHVPDLDHQQTLNKNRLTGLWKLLHGFRLSYLGANLSLGLAAFFMTATFFLLRYFVDNILGHPESRGQLPLFAIGFITIAALQGAFTYLSGRLAAHTAEGITMRLRNFLYDHIQRLTFSYHSKAKTGELIERVTSDVDALRRYFSEQAIGVGRIILLFVINLIAILNLNVQLALISIIVVPFIIVSSIFFFRKVTQVYEEYQEQEAVLSTTLQENLTGVRVVKAFARQEFEKAKFDKDNWEKFIRGRRFLTMHSLFWPISDVFCSFQMLAGYLFGASMVINGEISVGTYLAYTGLIVWLIWPMRNLGRLIVEASTGIVSFSRVQDIIRIEREQLEEGDHLPSGDISGDVTFEDVCFEYDDEEGMVLDGVSFECKPGKSIALLGSTGSGKTSLVNLLPRFYDITCGAIYLDGVDIRCYPRKFLRSQIGIVEQEPFLFSRSIRDNITYGVGREVSQEEVEEAAKVAAIHDVILSFPAGYETLIGEKGVTLSGGQKQRLAIARTLLKNPRILILDDSTSSVDTETEIEIRTALRALTKGRTTFIIAHRIQSVMEADQILVMEQGRIVQQGTHEQLIQQEGIYRKIFQIQTLIDTELDDELNQADAISPAALEPVIISD